jgi:predicted ArsR family transcriptional regulator
MSWYCWPLAIVISSAPALGISKRTLRQHLENIKRKLAIQPHPGESHVTTGK